MQQSTFDLFSQSFDEISKNWSDSLKEFDTLYPNYLKDENTNPLEKYESKWTAKIRKKLFWIVIKKYQYEFRTLVWALNVWDATYLNILIFPIDYNIKYHQSALAMESGSSFSSSFCLYLFNPAFVFSFVDSIESLTSDICNHIQHYI